MTKPKKKSVSEIKQVTRPIVISEGIIRPTGLLDPVILIKPVQNQVDDVLSEVKKRVQKQQRVLITTLTKKFAQELDLYFKQISIKSAYIHSDVNTIERLEILSDLRSGKYDVLIGINLLREGLDLPEVALVAIFDADKEGFLRSRTSLIQIVGRAARHSEGTVIMYADNMTRSMNEAIDETNRRRTVQIEYNKKHNITPKSTVRGDESIAHEVKEETKKMQNKKKEEDAKSRLTHSPFGFVEIKEKSDEMEMEIDSMYSNSVHGSKRRAKSMRKAEQLYANFDQVKNEMIIKLAGLSKKELKDKLEIAINALNFEEAAAIRDILKNQ